MADNKLKIGITQGDTNGIGWELILKIFADTRMCDICTPIIYGSQKVADHYRSAVEEGNSVKFTTVESARAAKGQRLFLVECGGVKTVTPSEPSAEAGAAAIAALERAVAELKSGDLDAIVTAPFNKETVQSEAFKCTGHTEYMAENFAGQNMMMMCSERLRVALITKHLPLQEVSGAISEELIKGDLVALRKTLIRDFAVVEPRIAVLSLNPHAGDGGLLGKEEGEIIIPAIRSAYAEGVMAFGPFAADGFFSSAGYKNYDAVVAIYHDQGLIPFKTLSPEGVNFTAGLDAVRTSPDHGVAYDIAGKGIADPTSMRNAIYMALDVVRSRREYDKFSANPLQRAERERSHRDVTIRDLSPQGLERL